MWNDRAYYAHFGDAFIENTGLEGGSIYNSVRVVSLVFDRMLREQRAWLNNFNDDDYKLCDKVRVTFENAIPMFRKVSFPPFDLAHLHSIPMCVCSKMQCELMRIKLATVALTDDASFDVDKHFN